MRPLWEVHNAKKQGFLLAETDQDMAIWLKDARLRRMREELHAMAEEQGRAGMSDGVRDAMSLIVNILMVIMMIGGLTCRDTCVVAYAGFTLVILAIESIGRELRR